MRWRYKIPLGFLLLLLALPVLFVLVVTQTGILRELIVSRINVLLPPQVPLQVAVGEISGPYYNGVVITRLAVISKARPSDTVLSAQQARLSYHWRDLWRRNWVVRRADIQGLRVNLPDDSTLRSWAEAVRPKEKTRPSGQFDLAVDTLNVVDAQFTGKDWGRFRVTDLYVTGGLRLTGGQYQASISNAEFNLPELAHTPVRAQVAGRIKSGDWTIDSLRVSSPRSSVLISGQGGKGGHLQVDTDPLSLDELSRALDLSLEGQARFAGSVSFDSAGAVHGEGFLSGDIQKLAVQGLEVIFDYRDGRVELPQLKGSALGAKFYGQGFLDLSGDTEVYGYTGTVRGFDLNQVAFETFTSDLSGWCAMRGRGLNERDLRLELELNLAGRRFDEYTFDSAAGQMVVTTRDLEFADGFSVRYKNTWIDLGGRVDYADSLEVFANVYFNDLRDFTGQTFIDSLAGRGYAFCNLSGMTESPDLAGQFESDSLRMYDLTTQDFSSRFFVPHVLDQRNGWAELSWGKSVGWSMPIDSVTTRLRLIGTQVRFDSARAFFPDVFVSTDGWLDWAHDTIPVRLFDLAGEFDGRAFYGSDTIQFTMDSVGFTFAPFAIEGELGRVHAQGTVDYDTRINAQARVDHFRFDPYWRRAFPGVPLEGTIALSANLGGDFLHPIIHSFGTANELVYDHHFIGDLSGAFTYADRRLAVDSFTLSHPQWTLNGAGSFPVDLSLEEVARRVLEVPMDLQVTGNGNALDPFVWFMPDVVESVRGPWDFSVRLTGTPNHPRLDGTARLSNGTVKAVELETPIENLDVTLQLRNDTIQILSARATMGDGRKQGTLTGQGMIEVETLNTYTYDLKLAGHELPARFEFQDYVATSDVDLAVTGSTRPLVSGTIRVLRAEDQEPFTYEDTLALPDTTLWDWDIAATGAGNYWIRNDQLNAELTFDLRLLRERGVLSLLGTAELVPGRGKVYVFDRTGRIERGVLTFDQPGSDDPMLDLEISFRIPRAGPTAANGSLGQTEYARDVDLTLLVGGRASEPLIRPAEGSPYSDQDILLLLAANRATSKDSLASESNLYLNRIKFAATGLLASQLERVMERAVGLETISLKPGTSAAETELTVGTYFLRNFYVYGTSAVSFDRGQEVGFEYRFRRGLYLDGRRDKDNLYRLNLHLNWEY